MSELLYRTLSGKRPQGMPNVYFSCHPDDFEKYFEEYSLKILRIQDCAFWYESDPRGGYDPEDLDLRLSQMQLFVMPVTTKLLTTKNRAMDVEFPLAMEKHIPVLPLMMEQGLDDVFSKRFGDLQYLAPFSTDDTKRSFDEVLTTYIKATLVSDELAQKVRAAFDAYIFLSYRKKDRRQAQELMRLIHRDPVCRDIAIWYDEFLVPGEDFNEAIAKMLEKSDLFALAVTPNLVNEPNYVMSTEYPAALGQNKPVLPVEMEKTDRAALAEHYKALPPVVPGEFGDEFRSALLGNLKKIAVTANDQDPGHNYLIGLAYLDGIDVEVDSARALELITGSAEAGVTEAMSQLVTMYETGKGVKRDYYQGIEWRKKLVERLREDFEAERTGAGPRIKSALALTSALDRLGHAQYDLKLLDDAEKTYCRLRDASQMMIDSGESYFWGYMTNSYTGLGNVAKLKGDLAAAQEHFEKSLEICRQLAREETSNEAKNQLDRIHLAENFVHLGDVAKGRGKLEQAREYYEQGLEVNRALAEDTGDQGYFYDLTLYYERLGSIASSMNDLGLALEYHKKGYEIAKARTEEKGVKKDRSLYVSCVKLGGIADEKGDISAAGEYFGESYRISKELMEEEDTVKSHRDHAHSCKLMGVVRNKSGDPDEALDYYKKAFEIFRSLNEQTGTAESRYDLASICGAIADLLFEEKDLPQALTYYEKQAEIIRPLAEETGTIESRMELSDAYLGLGDVYDGMGDLSAAHEEFLKAFDIRTQLVKKNEDPEARRKLAVCCERLGDNARSRGRLAEAKDHFLTELAHCTIMSLDGETLSIRRMTALCYEKLGRVSSDMNDTAAAYGYYRSCAAIREEIVKESGSIQHQTDLSRSYQDLGDIFQITDKKDLPRARGYYEKALSVMEQLAESSRTAEIRRGLAVCHERLGHNAYDSGDIPSASKHFNEYYRSAKEFADETGTIEARRDLSLALDHLADVALKRNDLPSMKSLCSSALTIITQIAEEADSPQARSDMARSLFKLAAIKAELGETDQAKEDYERSIAIGEGLVETTEIPKYSRNLANVYYYYASFCCDRNDLMTAKNIFQRLAELGKRSDVPRVQELASKAEKILRERF